MKELVARALLGEREAPGDHLLAGSIPDGVILRRGWLVPRLGGWMARMKGPAAAVTLGQTIVLAPGVTLTPQLLTHELAHVTQWKHDRLFPVRYVLASVRHGYRNNPYELEARALAHSAPATLPREDIT